MSKSLRLLRVNHMNVVLEDFYASTGLLTGLYGANIVLDHPEPDMHMGLFELGRVFFEMFVPKIYLLNSRYGPHFVGIEFQADMEVAREIINERKIRIVRDKGEAFHTHPQDAFGVSFEFYHDYFHDWNWEAKGGTSFRSAAYWRDEHPLGLTGHKGFTVAVHDIDAASAFFSSLMGGDILYDEARPHLAARAVGVQAADVVMELLTPTGEGTIQAHLRRHGEGIRSTVFGVRDIGQARRYFSERGVELAPGAAPGGVAVPPEASLGVIFEFAE